MTTSASRYGCSPPLFRFVAPLSAVVIAVDIAEQFLNAGLIRAVGAEDSASVAAYGTGYRLARLVTAPLVSFRQVGLVLATSPAAARLSARTALAVGACVVALLLAVATTPLRLWLAGVDAGSPEAGHLRTVLLLLCGVPLADGAFNLLVGLLLRRRRSVVVSVASGADVAMQILVASVLLAASAHPLVVPVGALYAGRLTKVAILATALVRGPPLWAPATARDADRGPTRPGGAELLPREGAPDGVELTSTDDGATVDDAVTRVEFARVSDVGQNTLACSPQHGERELTVGGGETSTDDAGIAADDDAAADDTDDDAEASELTTWDVAKFVGPLTMTEGLARLNRPIINAVVSSTEANGTLAVAALTVSYPIAHVLYGWLNQIKAAPAAFAKSPAVYAAVPRFAAVCVAAVASLSALVFFTPLQGLLVRGAMGASQEVADAVRPALRTFTFFALPVGVRAVTQGRLTLHKRTRHLVASGPLRVLSVVVFLFVLPLLGVHGAARGIAALFSGFVTETIVAVAGAAYGGMAELSRPPARPRTAPPASQV